MSSSGSSDGWDAGASLSPSNMALLSRREAIGTAAVAAASVPAPSFGVTPPLQGGAGVPPEPGRTVDVSTTINGQPVTLQLDVRASLLDMLRERLGLTGAKKGCDHGQCGACTVHLDGRRVVSCLTLAAKAHGRTILTIEGLEGEHLHPMQQAFIDHDALQCGYCTPGQIMAAIACVEEGNATSPGRIREYMSGNICRCGAYVGIVAAVQDAAGKMQRS